MIAELRELRELRSNGVIRITVIDYLTSFYRKRLNNGERKNFIHF